MKSSDTKRGRPKGWLEESMADPEFQSAYAREEAIEYFLTAIEAAMRDRGISRAELARRMGISPPAVTQMFQRTGNLSAETMVDMARHVGARVRFVLEPWSTEQRKAKKRRA